MASLSFKRGDTFEYAGQMLDEDGQPVDVTGWTLRSQVREKTTKSLLATLEIEWINQAQGLFRIFVSGSTADWPITVQVMDIEFTDADGRVVSSDTLTINPEEDVTR